MPIASVNGTTLWFEIQGEGDPILLIPGLGLDHAYYRFGEPLLRSKLKTILVDPRGVGASGKDSPASVHYTPDLWADDFAALIEHLRLGPVHVLGSSLGGCIAQAMALRHPQLCRSLIPIGSFSEADRAIQLNFELRKKIIARCGMGEEIGLFMGLFTLTREFMETEGGRAVMQANQATVRANSAELYTAFIDSILWWARRLPGQENTPLVTSELGRISCPTLVLAGDNDYFIPAAFSKIIHRAIAHSKYIEIPGGGHIPFIEKPRETVAEVLRFLTA
jgi:pimeloyl-ACP methyl ester carboxylesterase